MDIIPEIKRQILEKYLIIQLLIIMNLKREE